MDANITFIDIERFAALIRDHKKEWFYERKEIPNGRYSPSTRDSWLKFKKVPTKEIKIINAKLEKKSRFETINLADLLIRVNLTKDHTRGQTSKADNNISLCSGAKKVLQLLILGRLVEDDYKNSKLTVYKNNDNETELYKYLSCLCGTVSKGYYYLPGRSVSLNQIKELAKEKYSDSFSDKGIEKGIAGLLKAGLVKHSINNELNITEKSELYHLDFNGCYSFLKKSKPK